MKNSLSVSLSALMVCLLLGVGFLVKAETPSSGPVEDWRKWEPPPPKEAPQIIHEKGCQVKTIAGTGEKGLKDGPALSALFYKPIRLSQKSDGTIVVADIYNNAIRTVGLDGIVTTICGTGKLGSTDGPAKSSLLSHPHAVAVGLDGSVYIGEASGRKLRVIDLSGKLLTLAGSGEKGYQDGKGKEALFNTILSVTVDLDGNILACDIANNRIRKITTDGRVTTIAGTGAWGYKDGKASEAEFLMPMDLCVDNKGNIYIADIGNHCIRKIDSKNVVTTIAGKAGVVGYVDGEGTNALFYQPHGIAVNEKGEIFVADMLNHAIRKITPEGFVTTLAGTREIGFKNGEGKDSRFNRPGGVMVYRDGSIIVADIDNNALRTITFK
jgi:DNA-binding beta-propeller fold protein YncE